MSDLSELERLAREADQHGAHIYTHPRDSNNHAANAAYIAACSPDQVLRLVAIAKAAEKALPVLDRAADDGDVADCWRAADALREALSPLNETTKEPK